jgi:hypothetical protein
MDLDGIAYRPLGLATTMMVITKNDMVDGWRDGCRYAHPARSLW